MGRRPLFKNNNKFFEELKNKFDNKIPFAFSRWGDGEWATVSKENTEDTNCDGNIYYKDLGDKLESIVSEKQNYYMGHQNNKNMFSLRQNYPQDWVNSDLLHEMSEAGELHRFFKIFDAHHIVYIGNKSLSKLPFVDEFIEIPYKNVWLDYVEVMEEIKSKIVDKLFKVFLFSAGMASNSFIHDAWMYNKENIYMDASSAFDPYVGRISRSYMKGLTINSNNVY